MRKAKIEEEFRQKVREHLEALRTDLQTVLVQLIEHEYPNEVAALRFEVFADSFTHDFPVRTYFLDKDHTEFFLFVGDKAEYPSPVDPGLLQIEHVYPAALEDHYFDVDEGFDLWRFAAKELIAWFAECWTSAGGSSFRLEATISKHRSPREFNLVGGYWK